MANNSYTKTYVDGQDLFEADLDNGFQSLNMDISNSSGLANGSTTGQFLKSNGSGSACSFAAVPDPLGPGSLRNYGLSGTASSGALIVALKTAAAADPSGSDVVDLTFSSDGAPVSVMTSVSVNSARSLTVTNSASLGVVSTSSTLVYVYAINVSGTARLAVSSRADFDTGAEVSTTAMSASADSSGVLYASAALTVVARLLGSILTTRSAVGAWQSPSKVNITNTAPQANPNPISASTIGIAGYGLSKSSGSFSTSSTSFTDVTDGSTALSVTITSRGRPILVGLQQDGGATSAYVRSIAIGSTLSYGGDIKFLRGTTTIGLMSIVNTGSASSSSTATKYPPSAFSYIDVVAAGTYTYKVQLQSFSASTSRLDFIQTKLFAREL